MTPAVRIFVIQPSDLPRLLVAAGHSTHRIRDASYVQFDSDEEWNRANETGDETSTRFRVSTETLRRLFETDRIGMDWTTIEAIDPASPGAPSPGALFRLFTIDAGDLHVETDIPGVVGLLESSVGREISDESFRRHLRHYATKIDE